MKEFYLMRHGQTRFNVQHRLQGVCDAPLTEVGIEQAKKAGQYLAKQEPIFDHLFTSTSERASDTLEIVTGRTDYERLKGLKGQDFGAFEGQPEYLTPKTLPDGQGNCNVCVYDYNQGQLELLQVIDPISGLEVTL